MINKLKPLTYSGLSNDQWEGFTSIGQIIRDARIFGVINDDENCQGWRVDQIEALWEKINNKWGEYGCLASQLPPELQEKHERVHANALERAKELGWTPENWLTATDFQGWVKEEHMEEFLSPEWENSKHR
ncbi:hypothetical protein [Thiomicrorhabdus aquaedulcis]|uniref:hypothetical protein n=1 Tax=Thiomicrorhabdus aquaedulcis TaxID=2211106 RepID=UPI0018D55FD1|nr:hypothetical protein [Thiomicrorhabdus aquaedulcis]